MELFGYTFTFAKIKKQRKRTSGFSAKRWTPGEKRAMLTYAESGKNCVEIGEILDRTPASIYSMQYKIRGELNE